ncbi:MAG: O-antigen ligase family protein [Pseudomonadota bacterium]
MAPHRYSPERGWPNASQFWDESAYTALMMTFATVGLVVFLFGISRFGTDFIPSMTNLFWAVGWLAAGLALWLRPELMWRTVNRNIILLLLPILAALSALWSVTPSLSAFRGVLLLLNTFVGFALYFHFGLRRTLQAVFAFCFIAQVSSLGLIAIGHPSAFDHTGVVAKGFFLHKNNLAMNACLLFFTSLVLFADNWRRLLMLLGVGAALAGLVVSTSGTGLIVCVLMFMIVCACAIIAFGLRASQLLFGLGLCVFSCILVGISMYGIDVYGLLLDGLGKDHTLTGRTVLWDFAWHSFNQNPFLGVGYFAYWNSTETTASSAMLALGVPLQSFHNNFIDILVGLGMVGFVAMVVVVVGLMMRTFLQFLKARDAIVAWPFLYVCFMLIYCMSEYPLFWNGEYQMLFAFVAAASANAPTRLRIFRPGPTPIGDVELISA